MENIAFSYQIYKRMYIIDGILIADIVGWCGVGL